MVFIEEKGEELRVLTFSGAIAKRQLKVFRLRIHRPLLYYIVCAAAFGTAEGLKEHAARLAAEAAAAELAAADAEQAAAEAAEALRKGDIVLCCCCCCDN